MAEHPRPLVAVDVAAFTVLDADLKVLLIRRGLPPEALALPGGFVRVTGGTDEQGEDLDAAARRELFEETRLPASLWSPSSPPASALPAPAPLAQALPASAPTPSAASAPPPSAPPASAASATPPSAASALPPSAALSLTASTAPAALPLVQVHVFGAPDRDPRARVISVAYLAVLKPELAAFVRAGSDAAGVLWWSVADLDKVTLAFDHRSIVDRCLTRLRRDVDESAIARALVPVAFSVAELRAAVDAVHGKRSDPGNFRRRFQRLLEDGVITRAAGKRVTSRKPAAVYQFTVPPAAAAAAAAAAPP